MSVALNSNYLLILQKMRGTKTMCVVINQSKKMGSLFGVTLLSYRASTVIGKAEDKVLNLFGGRF